MRAIRSIAVFVAAILLAAVVALSVGAINALAAALLFAPDHEVISTTAQLIMPLSALTFVGLVGLLASCFAVWGVLYLCAIGNSDRRLGFIRTYFRAALAALAFTLALVAVPVAIGRSLLSPAWDRDLAAVLLVLVVMGAIAGVITERGAASQPSARTVEPSADAPDVVSPDDCRDWPMP